MKPLNEILEEIEKRCDGATEGPWKTPGNEFNLDNVAMRNYENKTLDVWYPSPILVIDKDFVLPTMDFIASSRTDVPRLLKALRVAINNLEYFNKRLDLENYEVEDYAKAALKQIESIMNGEGE